jgi:hypothetical protein
VIVRAQAWLARKWPALLVLVTLALLVRLCRDYGESQGLQWVEAGSYAATIALAVLCELLLQGPGKMAGCGLLALGYGLLLALAGMWESRDPFNRGMLIGLAIAAPLAFTVHFLANRRPVHPAIEP